MERALSAKLCQVGVAEEADSISVGVDCRNPFEKKTSLRRKIVQHDMRFELIINSNDSSYEFAKKKPSLKGRFYCYIEVPSEKITGFPLVIHLMSRRVRTGDQAKI